MQQHYNKQTVYSYLEHYLQHFLQDGDEKSAYVEKFEREVINEHLLIKRDIGGVILYYSDVDKEVAMFDYENLVGIVDTNYLDSF